jgi:hypothetical protein
MTLLPYIRDPATGSLIPSISTGGAAINATIKQIVAARRQGIIRTPNHPTYKRLFVEVTQEQKSFQTLLCERVAIVAVIFENRVVVIRGDECDYYFFSPLEKI